MLQHAFACTLDGCSTFCPIRRAKAAAQARIDIQSSAADAEAARVELAALQAKYGK
jgi:hypothetical protein